MTKQAQIKSTEGLPRLGGYELLGKVGKGGMGNVFKARQISMDRIVALKVLSSTLAKDKKFVERFQREAKAAAKLSHVNIIQSIDVGEEDGYHYFAMEYVQGPTMDDLLQKVKVLKEDFCLDIILQTARAIQAAEKLKIVHSDIKPSNIMITRDRVAKLADFGLARRVEEGATRAKQALVFGTPEYMSPEQALGKPDLDSRSDIYSLGIAFYQMVTGRLPFEGRTPRETVDLRITSNPVPIQQLNPSISEYTRQIIDKMMKRDRTHRYQNATELIGDLEFVIKQRSSSAEAKAAARMQIDIPPEELQAVEQFRYAPRRRRSLVGPLFGFACLAVLGAVIFYLVRNPDVVEKIQKHLTITIGPARQPDQAPAPAAPPSAPPVFVPQDIASGTGGSATGMIPVPVRKGPSDPKARQSYDEIMVMRKTQLAEKNFKGLLDLYRLYPENYKFAVEWQALQEQQKRDVEMAKSSYDTQNALMDNLVNGGKLQEALALAKNMGQGYPENIVQKEDLEKKIRQIEEAMSKQGQAQVANRGAAFQEYRDAAEPAYQLVAQEKYDEAMQKLDELALSPNLAPVQDIIKSEKGDIALLKDYVASVYEGGKSLQGKPFKVGGITGTLTEVSAGAVRYEAAGKQEQKKLAALQPEELNQLAKAGGFIASYNQGQLHLRCGLFYYFHGDLANFSSELLEAQKEGVSVERFKERMKR